MRGECSVHGDYCMEENNDDEPPDIFVVGAPCPPYSCQRSSKITPEQHRDFPTIFGNSAEGDDDDFETECGSVLKVLQDRRPRVFVMEQVLGFSSRFRSGLFANRTPLEYFYKLELIRAPGDETRPMHEAVDSVYLDCADWLQIPRPRIGFVY